MFSRAEYDVFHVSLRKIASYFMPFAETSQALFMVSLLTLYRVNSQYSLRQENKPRRIPFSFPSRELLLLSHDKKQQQPNTTTSDPATKPTTWYCTVEGRQISWSIYLFGVLAAILLLIGSSGLRVEYWVLTKAVVLCLSGCTALVMVLIPKLWAAHRGLEVDRAVLTSAATTLAIRCVRV